MSEQEPPHWHSEGPPDPAPEPTPEDTEQAYADALASGGGKDAFGFDVSGREVKYVDGVPIEKAEEQARKELEAIQQMRGTADQADEPSESPVPAPSSEPSQDEPEQEDAGPEDDGSETISPVAAAAYLMGEEPTPEQLETLAQIETERALSSGEAVADLAERQANYGEAMNEVLARNPGLTIETEDGPAANPAAASAIEPLLRHVRAAYGDAVAEHPAIIEQIYEQVGGDAKFGPGGPEQTAEAWVRAVAGNGPTDPFGMPVELDY